MSVQSRQKTNYAWAFPVFRSKKVNLGRDVTMGTWKILQYGEERVRFEKPDFQIDMLFQSSSYNVNGCSFDTYEGSIENLGVLRLQSYQFEPPAHENGQDSGDDLNQNDDYLRHRLKNSDW